jgi:DNA end-binding protein Ku
MAQKVWKGHLSFGLLNIPVFLNTCARDKRIDMHNYHVACNGPVKMPKFCPQCQVQLQPTEIFKGYETGTGIVKITDEELDSITPETGHIVEITECVKWDQLDPSLLAESYYILPDTAGTKGYSLLAKVLRDANLVALGQLTKNGREHIVVLRPKNRALMLHYLWYENEVNRVPEFESFEPVALTATEIKLGAQLAQSLASDFEHAKFEDGYAMRLNTLISSKLDKTIQAPAPVKTVAPPVMDISAALEASLKSPKRKIVPQEAAAPIAAAKGKSKKSRAA